MSTLQSMSHPSKSRKCGLALKCQLSRYGMVRSTPASLRWSSVQSDCLKVRKWQLKWQLEKPLLPQTIVRFSQNSYPGTSRQCNFICMAPLRHTKFIQPLRFQTKTSSKINPLTHWEPVEWSKNRCSMFFLLVYVRTLAAAFRISRLMDF